MKKKILTIVFVATVCLFTGCATYSNQVWTPDSFNYTLQRDRTSGEYADYFGFSWDLKPERK